MINKERARELQYMMAEIRRLSKEMRKLNDRLDRRIKTLTKLHDQGHGNYQANLDTIINSDLLISQIGSVFVATSHVLQGYSATIQAELAYIQLAAAIEDRATRRNLVHREL